MGLLDEAVRKYDAQKAAQEEREILRQVIRSGIAPFQPSPVDLFIKNDLDYRMCIVEVEFPSIDLSFQSKFDQDKMFSSPEEEFSRLANEMFQKIRYRETLPVPNNIILGED